MYTVRAVDRAQNASAPTSLVTVLFDKSAPPLVMNLTALTPTPLAPAISWNPGGSDNLSGLRT